MAGAEKLPAIMPHGRRMLQTRVDEDIGRGAVIACRSNTTVMSMVDPRFVLSGFLVGLLVGQTGVGGGALMTPLLVLLFNVHPATAVGTDLLYAAATKSVGTAVHGLNHTVDWRIVGRLALGSVPATLLTLAALAHFGLAGDHGNHLISVILGIVLLLTAAALLVRRRFLALVSPIFDAMPPARIGRLTVLTGAVLGLLVTISSVGAGALGVTVLLLLYPRRSMPVIVGSDIAHAVPLTLVAGAGHWWLGSVNWPLLGSLLCGSVPGIVLGSYLSARLPETVLRRLLAATLLLVGVKLLV
jgi:hypothetical protein